MPIYDFECLSCGERFEALAALAEEWEEVVGLGFGESDLTVVARALEQEGGRE